MCIFVQTKIYETYRSISSIHLLKSGNYVTDSTTSGPQTAQGISHSQT